MKLRKSAALILTILTILILFATLTIWHDKSPEKLSNKELLNSMTDLTDQIPLIEGVFSQVELAGKPAFYLVGLKENKGWPTRVSSACYYDPIASWIHFRKQGKSIGQDIVVYRYRSLEDFISLLEQEAAQTSGALDELKMSHWVAMPVSPWGVSMKLLAGILLIVVAVATANQIKKGSF